MSSDEYAGYLTTVKKELQKTITVEKQMNLCILNIVA